MEKRYLDPEFLARLSHLDIKARLVVEGFLTGLHTSPYKGFSQEFADYRQYMPGDEPKRIDWKVYARSDRFYIKEYQEETNLRAYILLDKSGSMGYGRKLSKLEYSKYLCASLAYLLFKQRDSVGIVTFDNKIREIIPPSSKKINFMRILERIENAAPGGETALSDVLSEFARKVKKRGLLILVSDMLDDLEAMVRSLRSFRYRKHEILVFQILDPDEYNFPFEESAVFFDLEDKSELVIQPGLLRKSYRQKFHKFLNGFQSRLFESYIDYELLLTSTSYDKALFAYLQKRSRLR